MLELREKRQTLKKFIKKGSRAINRFNGLGEIKSEWGGGQAKLQAIIPRGKGNHH